MLDSTKSYQRFFAELKRRHVFRVMAVYGIVGFVVLQVVDLAIPALLLPEWTYRLVALFLLVGFPIAIVLAWAFEQTPDGWRRTERAKPGEIEAIVAQPATKRWPAGVLALLGIGLLLGGWWIGRETAPGADTIAEAEITVAEPTVAVLPFTDMSPKGDQEYFSDGITEELINTLAKIRELRVIARTSAFAFKSENLDIRAVGDSLGARYLVEGSVRKAADELRITAQLIDAEDGSHLWSESYDRRLESIFEIQREIAESIADQLRIPLGLDAHDRLVSPTQDLEAYDFYLVGRARMRERGRESISEAVDLFEAAIARDSTWAPAWAGLAESRALVPYYPFSPDSALWAINLAAAERAAERALELDPDNPSALVALANVYRDRWQWDEAQSAYARALALDPENVEAHHQYAEFRAHLGRMDEAYTAAQRALALDRSPIRLNIAGWMASLNGRYEEAVTLLSEGVEMDPSGHLPALRSNFRQVYLHAEDWAEYRRLLLRELDTEDPGRAARLRAVWERDTPPTPAVADWIAESWNLREGAAIWMALGEYERGLEALKLHIDRNRPPFASTIRVFWRAFDPLRDDPRFEAILTERGLEGREPVRSETGGSL